MRISDWSSDVCSSDLLWLAVKPATSERVRMSPALRLRIPQPINSFKRSSTQSVRPTPQRLGPRTRPGLRRRVGADSRWGYNRWQIQLLRSEEHTSELQSLMRISYAVFCLKKKKTTTQEKNAQ